MSKAEPIPVSPAGPKRGRRSCGWRSFWPTVKPGRPAINLSVGEPQHPIPPFVGPVIAAHLSDFGRYPANKGTERFRRAAAEWLAPALRSAARRSIRRPKILVLNGTREGLFLAAIAASRFVAARSRPAGDPDPQSVLCRLWGGRDRRRVRAGLPPGDRAKRLPA